MPTFEIGLDDGRKLRIEADDHQAALAGVQHFMDQDAQKDRSFAGAAQRGVADVARGVGSTYDVLAGNKQGTTGEGIASAVDSPNYESTPAHTGLGAAGRSMVEAAPGALGAMGIGAATARIPVVGKYLAVPAALASIAAQYFGGNARDVAKNQGHEEPSMGDLARAAGTTGLQTAAQAIPVSRMIPGANKIVSTGVKGIGDAAWKLGKTVAAETAGNAGANAIGQVGNSAGTQKGTQFDPTQTLDAAITGAGLSAGGAGARGAVDAQSAFKYRNVTPENAPAAAALAERLQQASSGKPNKAALDAAERDIHSEIKQGASGLENLSQDAKNALARPSNLGASDLKTLKDELKGSSEGEAVMHLVQQAQMADLVRKSGRETGGQLVGGMSGGLGRVFGSLRNPAALAGAGVLGTVGMAPLLAHGPAAVAGLLGLYGGARAIDAMTGARNPVARFQKRFQQPGAQVRLAPPAAPAATVAPPGGPSVPVVPPKVKPWGNEPPLRPENTPAGKSNDVFAQLMRQVQQEVAPKVTKVSKANGKTQHTVEAPPMEAALKETAQFQPKEPSQLPYYGEEHADVADHKLANRPDYQNLSKERKSIIREGIIRGRTADEEGLRPLVKEAPTNDEKVAVQDLIEELHHTSSRQRAREAREHYAALVSPAIAAKIKAKLTDAFINKSKRKD